MGCKVKPSESLRKTLVRQHFSGPLSFSLEFTESGELSNIKQVSAEAPPALIHTMDLSGWDKNAVFPKYISPSCYSYPELTMLRIMFYGTPVGETQTVFSDYNCLYLVLRNQRRLKGNIREASDYGPFFIHSVEEEANGKRLFVFQP